MPMRDALLPEFDQEMAVTRRTLERVPTEKLAWKPHDKSWSLGSLAQHIADVPSWLAFTFASDSLDMAPGGVPLPTPPPLTSTADILAAFDKGVTEGREVLSKVDDTAMGEAWSLLSNGKVEMTVPRAVVVRSFVMNHLIHHRAQLGVYLRLLDVPVPATYGPSADEQG